MKYDHKAIEPKWQEKWEETGVFHAENGSDKPKTLKLMFVQEKLKKLD